MSKDDEIKALKAENKQLKAENKQLKAENKQLKAENKKLKAEKKLFSQLLWDNGLSQAQFLDNVIEKRQTATGNLQVGIENIKALTDIAKAHIPYFEWLTKQYMRKGKGMNEKNASIKARNDTADLVEVITGWRPEQTLRYQLYPPPRKKIS